MAAYLQRETHSDTQISRLLAVIECVKEMRASILNRTDALKLFVHRCDLIEIRAGNLVRAIECGNILFCKPVPELDRKHFYFCRAAKKAATTTLADIIMFDVARSPSPT